MRRAVIAAILALAPLSVGQAQEAASPGEPAADKAWLVRASRMEGAAGNVREAAQALQGAARSITAGGRVQAVAELSSAAAELDRRVSSAALAAEVLSR